MFISTWFLFITMYYKSILHYCNAFTVDNKEKQRELREAAIKRAQERTEELKQKQDEMKREQQKFSVSQQMKVIWYFLHI
jgi:hypothetical protein